VKFRLPHFSPATRIAMGLVSLIVTVLLLVDIALNLIPDQTDMQRKIRESTSERLAVQVTSLIQAQEWDTLKQIINQALARDREILSLAVRRQDGMIIVQAGNHHRQWVPPAEGKSTLTHVRVPIYASDQHWGDAEISYSPVTPQTLRQWLQTPVVALGLVIVPLGFLAFYLYMRRTLQYLDPTAAIPDRVRVAFDALTEGVAVIDRSGRIMMYNKAFRQLHPYAAEDMMGKQLSRLPWLVGSVEAITLPWELAMQSLSNSNGHLFTITQPDQGQARIIVNAAPILDARGKLRGCMVTFYDVTQLHHANEKMRSTLAELEASREQVEKQNEELMRLATRDSLTGCLNRRAFFSAAEPLMNKLRQEARNLICIMCDIDHFKNVNDTHGHQIGDQVIVAVARALNLHMRNGDLLCRYGGEEFCILLPGVPEESALEIAERLRAEIESRAGSSVRSVEGMRITASFGIASLKSGAEDLSELIELADFALYTSKRNGRNQVTVWSEDLGADSEATSQTGTATGSIA
jgi:diguanylate cyclase (GGDEF)-like protein/PAS domain S-box-containing protein